MALERIYTLLLFDVVCLAFPQLTLIFDAQSTAKVMCEGKRQIPDHKSNSGSLFTLQVTLCLKRMEKMTLNEQQRETFLKAYSWL